MQYQIVIRLIGVKPGKNKYWLTFETYAGALDRNQKYTFDFCGTEMEHSLSLTDSELGELKRMICDDFGYPPFDIEKAKSILGSGKDYIIDRGKADD